MLTRKADKVRNIDRLHIISRVDTDECIPWDGSTYPNGYGVVRKNKTMVIAHREAFLNHNGYLPEVVMHTCDNRRCVNVRHLKAGTTQENVDDKVAKGRHLVGSQVGNSKLTEEKVLLIRALSGKMYQRDIARKFNVSQTLVSSILRRTIWTHI